MQGFYEEQFRINEDILIYPNPITLGDLFIQLSNDQKPTKIEVQFHNKLGQLVLLKEVIVINGQFNLNVDTLSPGIYMLTLKMEGHISTHRIIKK